ncbi:MAG: UDP-glucose 4-epimerase GalE [Flavobacteriales bacterium]|nr:UDP-glucose 4-epimerase GalE [Flavobacteriales bacterium]
MNKELSCVLVTGGAGYIGSHTIIELFNAGVQTVISVDNYSNSTEETYARIEAVCGKNPVHYEADISHPGHLKTICKAHPEIQGIIHFAALKAVGESVEKPLEYYRNNLDGLLHVLECVAEFQIKSFIFSSSCTVYGQTSVFPVNENTPLSEPESPYGYTKLAGERIIRDFAVIHPEIHCVLLRYFNPVGAHPSGLIGEIQLQKPNNLVPIITMSAAGILPAFSVHGNDYPTRDGTCIRDYVHVCDIADAHVKALRFSQSEVQTVNPEIFNLGSGEGVSVLEAIKAFERVNQLVLNYAIGPRRAGDISAIYSDSSKAEKQLQWKPAYTLDDMMASAWKWQQNLGK